MTKEEFIQRLGMLIVEYEESTGNRATVGLNVCIAGSKEKIVQYNFDGEVMAEGLDVSSFLVSPIEGHSE